MVGYVVFLELLKSVAFVSYRLIAVAQFLKEDGLMVFFFFFFYFVRLA